MLCPVPLSHKHSLPWQRHPGSMAAQERRSFPQKRGRAGAVPSPGSPAESSVAPQRALPAPSRPLEAAPAALGAARSGAAAGNGHTEREQRLHPSGRGWRGSAKSLYREHFMREKTALTQQLSVCGGQSSFHFRVLLSMRKMRVH